MNQERYIAALEISSSKIIGTVARTHGDGQLDVIAVEQERGVECIKYGIIQNLEETAMTLMRILNRLERHPAVTPRKIEKVFVGLSGRSLRSITTEVSISLPEETEITEEIIHRLSEQARNKAIDSSLEVVDAVPRTYWVGKQETQSPKGVVGNNIRASFELIVCRSELMRNIQRTISDKVDIEIAGFFVTALSTGYLILSSEEKRLGCMLVDMGAETTSVTIYRGGALRYFATLPMGSRNITRDLTSLNILEERAEEIKISSANAMAKPTANPINIEGIKSSDVNNLVVARSEEIVANIIEQIEYAGMKSKELPGGIVCIGGGACMTGMLELLAKQSNMSAQMGKLPLYVHIADSKGAASTTIEVVSVAYSAATKTNVNCLAIPSAEELPPTGSELPDQQKASSGEENKKKKVKSGFLRNLQERLTGVFNAPPEDNDDLFDE